SPQVTQTRRRLRSTNTSSASPQVSTLVTTCPSWLESAINVGGRPQPGAPRYRSPWENSIPPLASATIVSSRSQDRPRRFRARRAHDKDFGTGFVDLEPLRVRFETVIGDL